MTSEPPGAATSEPATPEPATPEPATPEPAAPGAATPGGGPAATAPDDADATPGGAGGGADPTDDGGPGPAAGGPPPGPRHRRRRRHFRTRRILRILGVGLLALIVFVTAGSLLFNALTRFPVSVRPTSGSYVEVDGVAVHYRTWGDSGRPIVLVPGFLESTWVWHSVAPLLAVHHRVYAVDLAGFGYTQFDGHYGLADEAALVDGFVRVLHLRRPTLVGHSLGAAVVGEVALEHPGDVSRVIFADGDGLRLDPAPSWLLGAFTHSPFITTFYRIAVRADSIDKALIKSLCGPHCPALSNADLDAWLDPLRQGGEETAIQSMASHGVIGLDAAQVSAIRVPTAIIWGQDDTSTGGSLTGAERNLHHPPVRIIPGAAHLSMLADPGRFATDVEAEMAGRRT